MRGRVGQHEPGRTAHDPHHDECSEREHGEGEKHEAAIPKLFKHGRQRVCGAPMFRAAAFFRVYSARSAAARISALSHIRR